MSDPAAEPAPATGWDRPPFLIAHRGYSSRAPENTLVAFEEALRAGAEVLECDVQLSRDGVVVVLHDPRVDRTTDGQGRVRALDWQRLSRLDAGYAERFGDAFAGERIPRLEEVLELAKRRAQVFIEIKPEAIAGVEAHTLEAARRTGMLDDVGILSFAPVALRRVAAAEPRVPLGLVFRWWRQRYLVREALDVGAEYLVGYVTRLLGRPAIIEEARRHDLKVGAYVVDSEEAMRRLVRYGIDGMATNRIGELLPSLEGSRVP